MVEAIRQGDIPGVQIRCRRRLAVEREEGWRWLTEPERMRRWLAVEADLTGGGEEGGKLLLGLTFEGASWREEGIILSREAPRLWVLSFRRLAADWPAATRLTFELPMRGAGCEISVLQEGFEHLRLSECLTIWEAYRRRWRSALARLARAAAGG